MMTKDLYERLRKRRMKLAERIGQPVYMVFSNQALEELVDKKPTSLLDLKKIKGLGAYKISQFGTQIIEVIQQYLEETGQRLSSRYTGQQATGLYLAEEQAHYQPGVKPEMVFRVGEFLEFANTLLMAAPVVVAGEVGSVDHRKDYTFFTLLDSEEEAVLQCFIWDYKLKSLGIELVEGLELKVSGYGKIFKRRGSFSFDVENINLVGEGNLKQAFETLRARLAAEGFFDLVYKQTLPEYPTRIGLVTSEHADAKKDFLKHLGNFGLHIFHRDVRVEGIYAIEEIVEAIRWFNENLPDVDVLVITRGGGSLESLQVFNSETIAKAIRASKIPIITAIGHENDDTIADWVADKRCSTPTDAGRFISERWRLATLLVFNSQKWLEQHFQNLLHNALIKLEQMQNMPAILVQQSIINQHSQVQEAYTRLDQGFQRVLTLLDEHISRQAERLRVSDPMRKLAQGYSVVLKQGRVVKSHEQLLPNEPIEVRLYKGGFRGIVTDTQSDTKVG